MNGYDVSNISTIIQIMIGFYISVYDSLGYLKFNLYMLVFDYSSKTFEILKHLFRSI